MKEKVIKEIVLESNVSNVAAKEKLNEIIAINEECNTLNELIKRDQKDIFLSSMGILTALITLLLGCAPLISLLYGFDIYSIIFSSLIALVSVVAIILFLINIIKINNKKKRHIHDLNKNEKVLSLKCEVYNSLNQYNLDVTDDEKRIEEIKERLTSEILLGEIDLEEEKKKNSLFKSKSINKEGE